MAKLAALATIRANPDQIDPEKVALEKQIPIARVNCDRLTRMLPT